MGEDARGVLLAIASGVPWAARIYILASKSRVVSSVLPKLFPSQVNTLREICKCFVVSCNFFLAHYALAFASVGISNAKAIIRIISIILLAQVEFYLLGSRRSQVLKQDLGFHHFRSVMLQRCNLLGLVCPQDSDNTSVRF